ncbi:MAG: Fe-S protein assembly chaperone HscA [Deltaproteobacteria bacterium]|nr:Fe-S protein assembly chaperone HscA [Deltaproteobacteria bacterium]
MTLKPSDRILGIDLGTTNSLAAAVLPQGPEALTPPGAPGPLVPSVAVRVEGRWVAGRQAVPHRLTRPGDTFFSIKRLMGRGLEDLAEELPRIPYRVEGGDRKLVKVMADGQGFTPQEISAQILKEVKAGAEAALGESIRRAVITVPAYFDDAQRQATRDAGRMAGLEVERILNEPTAAALAYGLEQKAKGLVAVYDLGGGTFDISILRLDGQVFQVVATHGNTHLGGDDLDHALAEHLAARHPAAPLAEPLAKAALLREAERVKRKLSAALECDYRIDLGAGALSGRVTREELNALAAPLVAATLESCRAALAMGQVDPQQITEVVMVGGMSRVALVRQEVERFFGRRPNVAINPDEVVAVGAAVHGHMLGGHRKDYVLLDVNPLALGLETMGGTFTKIINANSTIPAQATEYFTTSADNQTAVELNIYQGEREFVRDCRNLGRFKLGGLPPMAAGLPKVKVTFTVDANGILTVAAEEERSGKAASIEVIPSHGLTSREIDRIMEDAVEHGMEDLTMRQLVEFRLTAQAVFRGIEKAWPQAQALFTPETQQAIRVQMTQVSAAAEGRDPWRLKAEMDRLGDLTRPLADAIISTAALRELKEFYQEHKERETP